MRRLRWAVLTVMLGMGAVSGCSGNTSESAVTARRPDPALAGRVFVSAGPSESSGDIYEVQFNPSASSN